MLSPVITRVVDSEEEQTIQPVLKRKSRRRSGVSEINRGLRSGWAIYFVLIIVLFYFAVIYYYPIIYTLILSLYRWSFIEQTFLGLKNYISLIHDEVFTSSVRNTLIYVIGTSLITVIGGLALALSVDRVSKQSQRLSVVYKSFFFVPVVVSFAAVSIVWKWIYDPQAGILNYALSTIGIPKIGWLTNPEVALWSIIIVGSWQNIGFNMVILLGGLKSIPDVYHEAATLEGASWFTILTRITIPLMRPVFLFTIVSTVVLAFKVFTPVFVMTSGGPLNSTTVVVHQIYIQGFKFWQMGYAASICIVFLILVVGLSLVQMKVMKLEKNT